MAKNEQSIEAAVRPVLEKIHQDAQRADKKVSKILRYLEENLFSENLSVKTLLADLGYRDREVRLRFHREIGDTIQNYIETARLEAAVNLLRIPSRFLVKEVAHQVGYSVEATFFVAFKKRSGVPPGKYRERLNDVSLTGSRAPELDVDQKFVEEVLWECIATAKEEKRVELALTGFTFETGAAYRELFRRSRIDFRSDRPKGVEIAERTFESLPTIRDDVSEDEYLRLHTEGLIAVGNARRLAGDWPGADKALTAAEGETQVHRIEPLVEAELHFYLGLLRSHQRRLTEAQRHFSLGLGFLNEKEDRSLRMKILLSRGEAAEFAGDFETALADYLKARDCVIALAQPDPYLLASIESHLVTGHALVGNLESAEESVARARSIVEDLGHGIAIAQVRWLEGLLEQSRGSLDDARGKLTEAKRGLIAAGETGNVAILNLDLALLELSQGNLQAAELLAREAIPELSVRDLDRETRAALELTDYAIRARRLTAETLLVLRTSAGPELTAPRRWQTR